MSDQAVNGLDLAEGERLLAASTPGPFSRDYECDKCELWHLESEPIGGGLGIRAHGVEDVDAIVWLLNNGSALVTALRAAQQQEDSLRDLANAVEKENANLLDERAKLRADLARVEAERDAEVEQHQELARIVGRLQARIAELIEAIKPFNDGLRFKVHRQDEHDRLAVAVEQAIDKEKVIE